MRTRYFIDLPSTVCRISARDARASIKAGDLKEIQDWFEPDGPDDVYRVVILRATAYDKRRKSVISKLATLRSIT